MRNINSVRCVQIVDGSGAPQTTEGYIQHLKVRFICKGVGLIHWVGSEDITAGNRHLIKYLIKIIDKDNLVVTGYW